MSDSLVNKIGKSIADRYCITGTIGEGGMGSVFAAIPFDDPSHNVAIKIIHRGRKLHAEDLLRFQKEASLMSQLNHPGIVTFYELGILREDEESEFGNGYYIVMEVVNGSNLKSLITSGGRNDLGFFFQVGLQLASALDYTHGKDIIHRDIKPQNIVVSKPSAGSKQIVVKLLDFGVAKLGDAMQFTGKDRGGDEIAGTPLYMAPELTKHVDAIADHRVDLYSLGCLLFEILAGETPFSGDSRDELAEKHATTIPPSICSLRDDVPKVVEDIIFKLLEKRPEKRYQTAFSLYIDLLRAQQLLSDGAPRHESHFMLAQVDKYAAVSAKLEMFGRDREFRELVGAYDDVATKSARSRISMITGGSGVGKTRLLSEMRSYFKTRQIRFVSGNFSRHEAALSFNALANAFNEYLIKVMKGQPLEASDLQRRIKTVMGPAAHSVASVVPGLQPYIKDLPESDIRYDADGLDFSTFAKAFSDFTRCLVLDSQPVVFIFDDLHWADEKSLKLIDLFFSNNNSQRFYLIVSYHPVYAARNSVLQSFLERFRKLRRRCQEFELTSLEPEPVSQIVATILGDQSVVTPDFSYYLMSESRGNPRYLVELVRRLVELRYLEPQGNGGAWNLDLVGVRSTQIIVGTIDLALGRIQKYEGYGLKVLEVAAVCGMSFYFESIVLEGELESLSAMLVLQEAMNDGIISGIQGDDGLRYLGKHYQFAHRKARDVIYDNIEGERRRELHRNVAARMEAITEYPDSKTAFALAHHFLQGLSEKVGSDYITKCLSRLVDAGRIAYTLGSLQSAERYFENALRLMDRHSTAVTDDNLKIFVTERLADLASQQKKIGRAILGYRDLLNMNLDPIFEFGIVNKLIHYQLVSGVVTESIQLIGKYIEMIGSPFPTRGIRSWVLLARSLIADTVGTFFGRGESLKICEDALAYSVSKDDSGETRTFAGELYRLASLAFSSFDAASAVSCHALAFEEARLGHCRPDVALRIVIDRSRLLARLGFYRLADRYIQMVVKVSRKLEISHLSHRAVFERVLCLDGRLGTFDRGHSGFEVARDGINQTDDRIGVSTTHFFASYLALTKGDMGQVAIQAEKAIRSVASRNWMSPRAVLILLFGHLLADERDSVVVKGETYLRRRARSAGRMDDMFVNFIAALVSFGKGDSALAQSSYLSGTMQFIDSWNQVLLYPFEEDFLGLFVVVFPALFEREYGRLMLRNAEMRGVYAALLKRVCRIQGAKYRDVPLLLRAQLAAKLSPTTGPGLFAKALGVARKRQNGLIEMLGMFWLGSLQSDQGRDTYPVSPMLAALDRARTLPVRAVANLIENVLERGAIAFPARVAEGAEQNRKSRFCGFPTPLAFKHLEFVSEAAISQTPLEEDVGESIALFRSCYQGIGGLCLLVDEDNVANSQLIRFDNRIEDVDSTTRFLLPYVGLQSTLYLPSSALPWHQSFSPGKESVSISDGPSDKVVKCLEDSTFVESAGRTWENSQVVPDGEPGSTLISPEQLQSEGHATAISSGGVVGAEAIENQGRSAQSMAALIPLACGAGSVGVLLIENVGTQFQTNVAASRSEMDLFGAQVAAVAMSKSNGIRATSQESATKRYNPGSYSLEEVPWLKLWSSGKLRRERESTWYLGMEVTANQYVLIFALISGHRLVREKLSSQLWHHAISLRSVCALAKREIQLDELRDDFAEIIRRVPEASTLDRISLVSTVFSGRDQKLVSGHFGPTRPVVIGHESVVKPENTVFLRFNSGADLRYWETNGSLAENQPYVVSYDTTSLEGQFPQHVRNSLARGLTNASTSGDLHAAMVDHLGVGALPRCYVGAVLAETKDAIAA